MTESPEWDAWTGLLNETPERDAWTGLNKITARDSWTRLLNETPEMNPPKDTAERMGNLKLFESFMFATLLQKSILDEPNKLFMNLMAIKR